MQFWETETAHCAGLPSFTLRGREGQAEGADQFQLQATPSLPASLYEERGNQQPHQPWPQGRRRRPRLVRRTCARAPARAGRRSRGPRPGLAKPEVSRGSRRPREPAGGGATETWRGKWGGAGRGAEPRGARAGRPAGAGAERSRPLWEIGMLSQSGGGAGDPGSPAPPEAEPCRDLGWVAASRPGVWGVRNPVEWSCGPGPFHLYFSPPWAAL